MVTEITSTYASIYSRPAQIVLTGCYALGRPRGSPEKRDRAESMGTETTVTGGADNSQRQHRGWRKVALSLSPGKYSLTKNFFWNRSCKHCTETSCGPFTKHPIACIDLSTHHHDQDTWQLNHHPKPPTAWGPGGPSNIGTGTTSLFLLIAE